MKKNKKLRQAKTSFEKMLDILRPYLPKADIRPPEPPRQWRLGNGCNKITAHPNKTGRLAQI
jgi:hypothetical protein